MGDRYVRMPSSMPRSDPSFSPQSSFIVETPNTGLPPTLSFWFPLVPDPGITIAHDDVWRGQRLLQDAVKAMDNEIPGSHLWLERVADAYKGKLCRDVSNPDFLLDNRRVRMMLGEGHPAVRLAKHYITLSILGRRVNPRIEPTKNWPSAHTPTFPSRYSTQRFFTSRIECDTLKM